MFRRTALTPTLTLAFALSASITALAELPGINDPNAYTEAKYRRELLDFNKQTLSGAYLRLAQPNGGYDENEVVEFLDDLALRLTNAGASTISEVPGQKAAKEILAEATALVAAGCDDPIVRYGHAVMLRDTGNATEAEKRMFEATDRLMPSRYPLFRLLIAAERSRVLFSQRGGRDRPQYFDFVKKHVAEVAASPEAKGVARRALYRFITDASAWDLGDMRVSEMERMLANPKSDPWLAHMLAGECYMAHALYRRGTGLPAGVSEENWKKFTDNLDRARGHYTKAFELEPAYPEPAAKMITVEMVSGGGRTREWFDKAVAAQLDYVPAYENLLYALTPRWGGSYEQMAAFSRECLEGRRYDTDVPFQFVYTLNRMMEDGGAVYVLNDETYRSAVPVIEGLAAAARGPAVQDAYRSYGVAYAAKLRKYDDARAALDRIRTPLSPWGASVFGFRPNELAGKVSAMSGPQRAAVAELDRRLATGKSDGALEELQRIHAALAKAAPDDAGTRFIYNKVRDFTFKRDFAAGDWVTIQPEKDLNGWTPVRGTWTVADNGALVGRADVEFTPDRTNRIGPTLAFRGDVGQRFVIKAHFGGDATDGGFFLNRSSIGEQAAVWIYQAHSNVLIPDAGKQDAVKFTTDKAGVDLLVEVWDIGFDVSVNGRKISAYRSLVPQQPITLSLDSMFLPFGKSVVVTGLQVKRLQERPNGTLARPRPLP